MSASEDEPIGARPRSAQGPIAARLVGVWSLTGYTEEAAGREDRHPFGPSPEGFLIYTPDGFVSARLMRPERARFTALDWHSATLEEYQEAGRGYIAYCGSYEIDEINETFTHVPAVSFLPNLIRRPLLRSVILEGANLTLSNTGAVSSNGIPVFTRLR